MNWLAHTLVGGGMVLLAAWAIFARIPQPGRASAPANGRSRPRFAGAVEPRTSLAHCAHADRASRTGGHRAAGCTTANRSLCPLAAAAGCARCGRVRCAVSDHRPVDAGHWLHHHRAVFAGPLANGAISAARIAGHGGAGAGRCGLPLHAADPAWTLSAFADVEPRARAV